MRVIRFHAGQLVGLLCDDATDQFSGYGRISDVSTGDEQYPYYIKILSVTQAEGFWGHAKVGEETVFQESELFELVDPNDVLKEIL